MHSAKSGQTRQSVHCTVSSYYIALTILSRVYLVCEAQTGCGCVYLVCEAQTGCGCVYLVCEAQTGCGCVYLVYEAQTGCVYLVYEAQTGCGCELGPVSGAGQPF